MAILGRWSLYSIFSFGLTYLVIQHALLTREQFYPTVIYLTSSKFSIVVLCNIAMVLIVNVTKILKTFFLGDLRPNEVEVSNQAPGNKDGICHYFFLLISNLSSFDGFVYVDNPPCKEKTASVLSYAM